MRVESKKPKPNPVPREFHVGDKIQVSLNGCIVMGSSKRTATAMNSTDAKAA
jgi:hypothetical protein